MRFVLVGAWPVAVFGLLDVVLLAWALAASAKAALACEALVLTGEALVWRAVAADGTRRDARIEASRARLEVEGPRGALWLGDGATRIALGVFLSAAERAQVRGIIEAGLLRWRRARRG